LDRLQDNPYQDNLISVSDLLQDNPYKDNIISVSDPLRDNIISVLAQQVLLVRL
jgi:hypothetical protein